MKQTEFFISPQGEVMIHDEHGVRTYREEDKELTAEMLATIEADYPKAYAALNEIYLRSLQNTPFFQFRIVNRFIRCNFGRYDKISDVDHCGKLNFENVDCPMVGECLYHNVICNPEFNTNLSIREKEVMRLYCDGLKEPEIADQLYISPETVKKHKRNALLRTECRSLTEFVIYANNGKNG